MKKFLIAFKSGHYKTIIGEWKGDSVWCHIVSVSGAEYHINKSEVEYMEVRSVELK